MAVTNDYAEAKASGPDCKATQNEGRVYFSIAWSRSGTKS